MAHPVSAISGTWLERAVCSTCTAAATVTFPSIFGDFSSSIHGSVSISTIILIDIDSTMARFNLIPVEYPQVRNVGMILCDTVGSPSTPTPEAVIGDHRILDCLDTADDNT